MSLCIVAYNNYEDIKIALSSMEKYTTSKLIKKIYIVDNGAAVSNPNDVESFEKFIQNNEEIEYIDAGENLGFGKGHNIVIDRIDSEYHAIINPDIILHSL